jgi:hypothetical protein
VTLEEAAAAFGRIADEMEAAARQVTTESLDDALATARALSEGTLTRQTLRSLRHPYRHGGAPPQDPAIINRQGGGFAGAWQIEGGKVVNRSPQAEWLRAGTPRMIARPTVERVEEQVGPRHQERAERALRALFGG